MKNKQFYYPYLNRGCVGEKIKTPGNKKPDYTKPYTGPSEYNDDKYEGWLITEMTVIRKKLIKRLFVEQILDKGKGSHMVVAETTETTTEGHRYATMLTQPKSLEEAIRLLQEYGAQLKDETLQEKQPIHR